MAVGFPDFLRMGSGWASAPSAGGVVGFPDFLRYGMGWASAPAAPGDGCGTYRVTYQTWDLRTCTMTAEWTEDVECCLSALVRETLHSLDCTLDPAAGGLSAECCGGAPDAGDYPDGTEFVVERTTYNFGTCEEVSRVCTPMGVCACYPDPAADIVAAEVPLTIYATFSGPINPTACNAFLGAIPMTFRGSELRAYEADAWGEVTALGASCPVGAGVDANLLWMSEEVVAEDYGGGDYLAFRCCLILADPAESPECDTQMGVKWVTVYGGVRSIVFCAILPINTGDMVAAGSDPFFYTVDAGAVFNGMAPCWGGLGSGNLVDFTE